MPGLSIHPIDGDADAVSAFMVVKVRYENGDHGWSFRTTERPNHEEVLGALTIQVELLKQSILKEWEVD